MKQKVFLLFFSCFMTLFVQGKDDNTLRCLVFSPQMYYQGIEAAVFKNGSFVTYHTNDGYNSFVKDVEYSSDYSSVLTYYLNPKDANLSGYTFKIIANIFDLDGGRSRGQKLDYASLFDIESDKMTVNNGKLCLPVKITQENKEKIKFNPNHQVLMFALMAHRDESVESEETTLVSDYGVACFSTHEEKTMDISFKGISWWDEEGDYSIDLPTHVFQVTEDNLDNIKDSIIVSGDDGHPVNIHKVSTDANGITKCCLAVEDGSEKVYGYTYVQVKLLQNITAINSPIDNSRRDKDSNVYNILGQKVSGVSKGLYIKKGKVFFKH